MTQRWGNLLDLDQETQESLRALAFTTCKKVAGWSWGAAGLSAGVLKFDEMFTDLVALAFTEQARDRDLTTVQAVFNVSKAWSKDQYAMCGGVRWHTDADGKRVFVVSAPAVVEFEESGALFDNPPIKYGGEEANPQAEREWARISKLITDRQREVVESYATTGNYEETGRILGLHGSTVANAVRRVREVANAGSTYTTTEGAE
jgi:DNA-binding CsgD family transcriptional regulator